MLAAPVFSDRLRGLTMAFGVAGAGVAVRPMIEHSGRVPLLSLTFGNTDILEIAEMSNKVSAAALSTSIGATDTMSSCRSMPLTTSADAVEAMQKASTAVYQASKSPTRPIAPAMPGRRRSLAGGVVLALRHTTAKPPAMDDF